jgi:activator of 2-hydroxyglutaryl-CoA dehydratase
MGELSLTATKDVPVTSSCAVFAESEVISRVYGGEAKADILKGINDSIAARVASMLLSLGIETDVAMVGGVARNVGMVDAIRRHGKTDILVPEAPQIVAALGAALAAKDRTGKES